MFKLTSKLALSNLKQNRKLYYPFALAVILTTMILYSFIALATTPHLEASYGGRTARSVLGFGSFVVQLVVIILVAYANGYVMKNRSKELGLYSVLGMEKKHLLVMTLWELLFFYILTVGAGLGLGLLFDPLIFALLLKCMGLPVVIQSTFQIGAVLNTLFGLALAFALILLLNSFRLLRYSSLHLMQQKKAGEKKGRFLLVQTLLGLGLLGIAFYLALTAERPVAAVQRFFIAVILVILATYLLFNAGTITFLRFLKGRKSYYYKPENFISVSNLIARMRKNAAGLATISILSTMVLVTLTGSLNLFIGGQNYLDTMYPSDYNIIVGHMTSEAETEPVIEEVQAQIKKVADATHLSDYQVNQTTYWSAEIRKIDGKVLEVYDQSDQETGQELKTEGVVYFFDQATYEQLTGQKVELGENEILAYGYQYPGRLDSQLEINGKSFAIKQKLDSNFIQGKLPQADLFQHQMGLYLVLPDLNQLGLKIDKNLEFSISAKNKENQDFIAGMAKELYSTDKMSQYGGTLYGGVDRYSMEKEWRESAGTILFIGVFLSVIFLLATVLVIYYKQISEGYEDRENFVILQQVGLDQKQTGTTIRKQILTVFFLPLFFSFLYLGVAYKMIAKIVALLGANNAGLVLQTTLAICAVFFISYILVFLLTSRSYRKIVVR
ncbi:FtsX-like permease family protein [Streptococcus parasanguinis]|uniref:FtsX-like permease family protein n=1 Tax=Streptococcus parasanguinis TaxID=1318 RepID=UPI001D099E35|nr:FtsX-like permease family protein [Streptococcus parasanguinis]MCB6478682.1 FtsX-like permease family protein [Streptococcus parasanguinis]MCQ5185532.1 FtsX-like permease family protein [Streptococcus parasanguinis]